MWSYIKNNKYLTFLQVLALSWLAYYVFVCQELQTLIVICTLSVFIAEARIIKRIDTWFETLFLVDEEK